jgi:hypothetical protein
MSVYVSLSEDGSTLPAKKGKDDKEHIEGRGVREMVLKRMDPKGVYEGL